jgi:hypothetical protein
MPGKEDRILELVGRAGREGMRSIALRTEFVTPRLGALRRPPRLTGGAPS